MGALTCTKRSYRLDITNTQMIRLERSEDFGAPVTTTLLDKLNALPGVSGIEYNGHFGAAVYFDIDAEDDTAAAREGIRGLILTHIDGLKRKPRKRG